MFEQISIELQNYINKTYQESYKSFFKTKKGEYSAEDIFLGIKVPKLRKSVRKHFKTLSFEDIKKFLYSPYHEYRLFALLVLVAKYQDKNSSKEEQKRIYDFYVENISQVNNWDLVDVTTSHIIGKYLYGKEKSILYDFANSNDLWQKRIAIVSTFYFIKQGSYEDTLNIADILLNDTHDLIHKAVGWAIRNVGNKNEQIMLEYLQSRYKTMPRTTLRYAIEKLDKEIRQKYLKGLI
ncbi:DNA alkylation repair protein [Sulfurimonas marina]|uniref:DNA alkylation repair protein n=1 Tax=Sulfurimonas marina TaxID=2590551 RepID=A0A7M1AY71_9BACT|nr:DNA alkylation repair protein [Sulfurimonas marina]QOP41332.1 DNA alkylation repair protein [Sulfurimonas marina]